MRKLPVKAMLAAIAFVLCLAAGEHAYAVRIAQPAPGFTLKDTAGRPISLESFKGRVVILNFWSTNCPPCVAELPSLNALYHELKGQGLVVLGISLDPSVRPVKAMMERMHLEYPVVMDSEQTVFFDSYALFGQPASVIVDKRGIVQ
ncbi:MAG TPA: TlpA disulfide reductase family protein, partial [Geobacteraceae bacterium]